MLIPETVFTFILASTLLALAPGPDNLFVLIQSVLYGPKAGILITLGLCSGLLIHTSAVILGVATFFQSSTMAFNSLKIIGALYLLYLAWRLLRNDAIKRQVPHIDGTEDLPKLSAFQLYRRGIIMNLSNPKVLIFFLAFLPQFIDDRKGMIEFQLMVLGIIFIVITLLIFSGVAVLSGSLGNVLKNFPLAGTVLNRLAGIIFIGLAFNLLLARQ